MWGAGRQKVWIVLLEMSGLDKALNCTLLCPPKFWLQIPSPQIPEQSKGHKVTLSPRVESQKTSPQTAGQLYRTMEVWELCELCAAHSGEALRTMGVMQWPLWLRKLMPMVHCVGDPGTRMSGVSLFLTHLRAGLCSQRRDARASSLADSAHTCRGGPFARRISTVHTV